MNDPAEIAADFRAGVVASTLATSQGAKKRGGDPLTPSDLFPSLRSAKPAQGWRAAKERLGAYLGGVDLAVKQGAKPARAKGR